MLSVYQEVTHLATTNIMSIPHHPETPQEEYLAAILDEMRGINARLDRAVQPTVAPAPTGQIAIQEPAFQEAAKPITEQYNLQNKSEVKPHERYNKRTR